MAEDNNTNFGNIVRDAIVNNKTIAVTYMIMTIIILILISMFFFKDDKNISSLEKYPGYAYIGLNATPDVLVTASVDNCQLKEIDWGHGKKSAVNGTLRYIDRSDFGSERHIAEVYSNGMNMAIEIYLDRICK